MSQKELFETWIGKKTENQVVSCIKIMVDTIQW